jgi:iron complex outermembrane recepter protein
MSIRSFHFVSAIILGVSFLLGIEARVNAQNAPSEFTLEEITVTAEKRETSIQKTPTAITAITGDTLIEESAVSIMDVMKNVPNITPMPSGGGNNIHISIRGIGSDVPDAESGVSVNFDGSANNNTPMGNFGYVDLDRIEVLRGPQGTLYGRNASTGVINILTKNPKTEKIEGYSVFELGNYKLLREEGAVNFPLSDKFAARIAFSNINREGWMIYGSADSVGTVVRAKIGYYPNNDVSVVFSASSTKMGGVGPNTAITFADWEAGRYHNSVEWPPYHKNDSRNYTYNMNVNVTAGPGVITFIPNYNKFMNRGWASARGPNPALPEWMTNLVMQQSVSDNEEKSLELRYASLAEARIQWLAGLYYYDQTQENAPDPSRGQTVPVFGGGESKAAFGQITYPITDAFRAIAGARWAENTRTYENQNSPAPLDLSADFGRVTWKAALEADLAKDVLSYLTVATATKPGGFNTFGGGTTFKAERSISYEAGVKSRFLDKRLQLNGTLFYTDYKDFQAIDAFFDQNGDMQVNFFNVDKTESYGAEFESEALMGDTTRVNMSVSYLHNRYKSSYPLHDGPVFLDLKDRPLSHAPAWSVIAGIEHAFVIGEAGTLKPRISGRWTDKQYVGVFPNDASLQDAYAVVDANLLFASNNNWSMNLYVKNAFDEVYKTGFNAGMIMVSEPRMFGATLQIKF